MGNLNYFVSTVPGALITANIVQICSLQCLIYLHLPHTDFLDPGFQLFTLEEDNEH